MTRKLSETPLLDRVSKYHYIFGLFLLLIIRSLYFDHLPNQLAMEGGFLVFLMVLVLSFAGGYLLRLGLSRLAVGRGVARLIGFLLWAIGMFAFNGTYLLVVLLGLGAPLLTEGRLSRRR